MERLINLHQERAIAQLPRTRPMATKYQLDDRGEWVEITIPPITEAYHATMEEVDNIILPPLN